MSLAVFSCSPVEVFDLHTSMAAVSAGPFFACWAGRFKWAGSRTDRADHREEA